MTFLRPTKGSWPCDFSKIHECSNKLSIFEQDTLDRNSALSISKATSVHALYPVSTGQETVQKELQILGMHCRLHLLKNLRGDCVD